MEELNNILDAKRAKGLLIKPNECSHKNVVKEYFNSTHSDYACMDCGKHSLVLEHFGR